MKNLSSKWQKLIVWLSGYLGITSFLIGAGFVYIKTDDEDVRTSCKVTLFLVALFTGASILFSTILYNLMYVLELYTAANVFSDILGVINIIKALIFVTFFILDILGIKILPSVRKKDEAPALDDVIVE